MIRIHMMCALLIPASLAHAATYTVGGGGTHATIQDAIDAALVAPGSDVIRVAAGTFTENLDFTPTGSGNALEISGGWINSFTSQSESPTTIDGGMAGGVFNVNIGVGDGLTLLNLRIQNGLAPLAAGILINQNGDSQVHIEDCEIVSNIAQDPRAEAAGMRVWVNGTSTFTLLDSLVSDNHSVCSGDVDCREGGMQLQAANSAVATLRRNAITDNTVTIASGSAFSGGARIIGYDASTITFEDNVVTGNSVSGTSSSGVGVGVGLSGDGTKIARRNWIGNNTSNVPVPNNMPQLNFAQWGDGTSVLSDTVVVKGNGRGVTLGTSGDGTATIHATNLTIADHAFTGIQSQHSAASGTMTVSNTISVGNATNASLEGGVSTVTNLFSGDAMFTDAAADDYSLMPGSPAIDAGTNAPPGGLGPTDINGDARVTGGTVDIGAYESMPAPIIEDGFESS